MHYYKDLFVHRSRYSLQQESNVASFSFFQNDTQYSYRGGHDRHLSAVHTKTQHFPPRLLF